MQAAVNLANVTAITEAEKATIIEKLNVLEVKNVVVANAEAYATDESNITELVPATVVEDAQLKAVQAAVNADNLAVSEGAQLKAINNAKTVAEVKAALDALVNVESENVRGYLTIRSADRDFVAAHILENRPEVDGYENIGAIKTEIETDGAIVAHAAALEGINELTYTTTPNLVVEALSAIQDEDFNKLSAVAKQDAAEAFQDKLGFDEDGALKTPFITLAAVKALLK